MITMSVISNKQMIDFEVAFYRFFLRDQPQRFSQIRSRDSRLFCLN